jgi:hypothetical protein
MADYLPGATPDQSTGAPGTDGTANLAGSDPTTDLSAPVSHTFEQNLSGVVAGEGSHSGTPVNEGLFGYSGPTDTGMGEGNPNPHKVHGEVA